MFILSYWTVQKLKYGIVVFFESVEPIKQLTNWLAKKKARMNPWLIVRKRADPMQLIILHLVCSLYLRGWSQEKKSVKGADHNRWVTWRAKMYLFFLIYNGVKRKVCKPQILAYNPARKLLFQVNYLMPIQNSTALNEQSHPRYCALG